MRLIDADALIEKVNEKKPIGRFTLVEYLKNAPTVDINQPAIWWNGYDTGKVIGEQERLHEWEDYSASFYRCPECGYLLDKYCPNCYNKVILPKEGGRQ